MYPFPAASEQRHWFKFMHNLHPLGKRKQQMGNKLDQTTTLDTCPCCNACTEDQRHFILCANNPNSSQAHIVSLTTYGSKYRENHKFVDIMTDCIEQWLTEPHRNPGIDFPTNPKLYPYTDHLEPHMITILQDALDEQHRIGWINAIRGFLSKKWKLLASTHMDNKNAPANTQDGTRRIGTIIQRIEAFVKTKWEGRNNALHKHSHDEVEKFRTLEAAEIRHFHTQPHLLPVGDQHYCNGPLVKLLRSRPAYRRRWLRRVRKARANMIQDQCRQATITTYFARITTTRNDQLPIANNDTHQHHHIQTTIQMNQDSTQTTARPNRFQQRQAKVTHFFPGRPPDNRPQCSSTTTESHA